jgi:MbtH protein
VSNPFEDDAAVYRVLVNAEGQHSLWPEFADVPAGWDIALPAGTRQECLEFVEANWTDMRPKSLVEAMNAAGRHS